MPVTLIYTCFQTKFLFIFMFLQLFLTDFERYMYSLCLSLPLLGGPRVRKTLDMSERSQLAGLTFTSVWIWTTHTFNILYTMVSLSFPSCSSKELSIGKLLDIRLQTFVTGATCSEGQDIKMFSDKFEFHLFTLSKA